VGLVGARYGGNCHTLPEALWPLWWAWCLTVVWREGCLPRLVRSVGNTERNFARVERKWHSFRCRATGGSECRVLGAGFCAESLYDSVVTWISSCVRRQTVAYLPGSSSGQFTPGEIFFGARGYAASARGARGRRTCHGSGHAAPRRRCAPACAASARGARGRRTCHGSGHAAPRRRCARACAASARGARRRRVCHGSGHAAPVRADARGFSARRTGAAHVPR
jgi:hypothetical protein